MSRGGIRVLRGLIVKKGVKTFKGTLLDNKKTSFVALNEIHKDIF